MSVIKKSRLKTFSYDWNEDSKTLNMKMGFYWSNYRKDWHKCGFDLTNSLKVYFTFPELPPQCEVVDYKGQFDSNGGSQSYLNVKMQGERCDEVVEYFYLLDASATFYQVPFLDKSCELEPTEVLRLVIYDAADKN